MAANNTQLEFLRRLQQILAGGLDDDDDDEDDEDGEEVNDEDDDDDDMDDDDDDDDDDDEHEDGEGGEDGAEPEDDDEPVFEAATEQDESVHDQRTRVAIAAGDKVAQQALASELYSDYMLDKLRGAERSAFELLRRRERHGHLPRGDQVATAARFVPNRKTGTLARSNQHYFCGSYSADGSVYMSACQDATITLHDTLSDDRIIKTIHARDVGWSIIDTDYSPDQRFLIYSSWSTYVHLCNVFQSEGTELHLPLDFRPTGVRGYGFCLFSIKFSSDSKEIIAGSSSESIFVYNLERQSRVLQINGHGNDVNAVAWADDSSQLLYSGSDDSLCKVWDRRSLRDNQPVGVMAGHREGITYIHPKGDGRYFLSNGKDHVIKLWDLRNMTSTGHRISARHTGFDYRYAPDSGRVRPNLRPLASDTSVQTYAGHQVLRTLIRAKFSPSATTGQQYIYGGSADGNIFVWDVLTGDVVKRLGRGHVSLMSLTQ